MYSELKAFRIFIAIEYVLGLYRSYFTFRYFIKVLIVTRVTAEFLFTSYILYTRLSFWKDSYLLINNVFSLSLMVLACCTSRSFVVFINSINRSHSTFKNDETYSRNMKWCLKVSVSLLASYFIAYVILIVAFVRINYHSMLKGSLFRDGVVVLSKMMNNYRLHFGQVFHYCIIYTISEQIRCLIRAVQRADFIASISTQEYNEKDHDNITIEKWRQAYMNIKGSLIMFNAFCGIQITMSLAVEVVYYITIIYSMVSLGLIGGYRLYGAISFAVGLSQSLLITCLVARAAHRLESSAWALVISLRQRLIHLNPDDRSYKAVKNFLRVLDTQQMSIKVLGGFCLNMTLLPACFALVTSYTVTMLQFNNVL